MKIVSLIIIVATAIGITSCANPTATNAARLANRRSSSTGSPFRWVTQNVNGGTMMTQVMVDLPRGASRANPILKNDILALITKAERTKGRAVPEIEEIKLLPDGREVWVLKAGKAGIAYVVALKPSPQGGTDIGLSGPTMYQKNGG